MRNRESWTTFDECRFVADLGTGRYRTRPLGMTRADLLRGYLYGCRHRLA